MKVLFLANRIPYPPHRGDKLKIYNLARRLKQNHTLYLITFIQHKSEYAYRAEMERIFEEVHFIYLPTWLSWIKSALNFFYSTPFQIAYFRHSGMKKLVDKFVQNHQIDVIHTQHLRMAQYTKDITAVRRILDLPDAYSLYWQRRKQVKRPWYNQIFDNIESSRVVKYESVVHQFDLNLLCSVEDRDHIRKVHPGVHAELLRNGVDLELFKFDDHDYSKNKTLLFTGNMDYAPNVDAVIYFVENLFSKILETHPEIKLVIAGQRPVNSVKELARNNIQITGFVEDIAAMYKQADVVIAPLRFGAGTQNKVLEAMAMGVPVVCTDIGFSGLEISSGDGVIHAANDDEFIQSVNDLLNNADLREQVGQKGLFVAQTKFSWDGISRQLEHYLGEDNFN